MKRILQAGALCLAAATLGIWLATGSHCGLTKTQVEKVTLDEVTGIEGRHFEKKFVAGVDFLIAGAFCAGACAVLSLFFRKQPKSN